MTDERPVRAGKSRPWIELGTRELRAALVALLAGVYLAVWPRLSVPREDAEPAPVAIEARAELRTVWLDQLPASERPAVALPPGWQIASSSTISTVAPAAATPSVSHARVPRVTRTHGRIRTRSS